MVGRLLDVRRYADGTFTVTPMWTEEGTKPLSFGNSFDCQQFVSNWYSRKLIPVNQ